jgi:hypothetical protein
VSLAAGRGRATRQRLVVHRKDLGRCLGIGGVTGKNAIGARALLRLEQSRIAIALPDGSMAARTELPPPHDNQLRRAVQRSHDELCQGAPERALTK